MMDRWTASPPRPAATGMDGAGTHTTVGMVHLREIRKFQKGVHHPKGIPHGCFAAMLEQAGIVGRVDPAVGRLLQLQAITAHRRWPHPRWPQLPSLDLNLLRHICSFLPPRVNEDALHALQECTEAFAVALLKSANLVAIHRGSDCVQPADIELAHRLSGYAAQLGFCSMHTAAGRGEVLVAELRRGADSDAGGSESAEEPALCEGCGTKRPTRRVTPLLLRSTLPGVAEPDAPRVDMNFALSRGLKKLCRRAGVKYELEASLSVVAGLMSAFAAAIIRAGRDPETWAAQQSRTGRAPTVTLRAIALFSDTVQSLASVPLLINTAADDYTSVNIMDVNDDFSDADESMSDGSDEEMGDEDISQLDIILHGVTMLGCEVYAAAELENEEGIDDRIDCGVGNNCTSSPEDCHCEDRCQFVRTETCGICTRHQSYIYQVCKNVPMGHCNKVPWDHDEKCRRIALFLGGTAVSPPADLVQYVDSCLRVTGPFSEARQRLLKFSELISEASAEVVAHQQLSNLNLNALQERYGVGAGYEPCPHSAAFNRIALRAGAFIDLHRTGSLLTEVIDVAKQWLIGVLPDAVLFRSLRVNAFTQAEPLRYHDIARAVARRMTDLTGRGDRVLMQCLAHTDSWGVPWDHHAGVSHGPPGGGANTQEVRAQPSGSSMTISLGESTTSDDELGKFTLDESYGPHASIAQIQGVLQAATDAVRAGQSTAEPTSDGVTPWPLRRIAELLASARGVPQIAGVSGTATPELSAFVHEVLGETGHEQILGGAYLGQAAWVGLGWPEAEIIDASGVELLAWILERYLETLLGTAAEVASHASANVRRWFHDANIPYVPAATGEEREERQALYNVFPKDIQLARRLMGAKLDRDAFDGSSGN